MAKSSLPPIAALPLCAAASFLLFLTGCATIMTPMQMNARRGSGTRGTIAGPSADVLNTFTENLQKAEYKVTREDNAAYATHSAGVNVALFIEPGSSEESTNVEILYLCSLLGSKLLRSSEAGTLKSISNEVELKHLKRKALKGGGVVNSSPLEPPKNIPANPDVPATEPDSAAAPVAAAPVEKVKAKPARQSPPTPAEEKKIDEQLMP